MAPAVEEMKMKLTILQQQLGQNFFFGTKVFLWKKKSKTLLYEQNPFPNHPKMAFTQRSETIKQTSTPTADSESSIKHKKKTSPIPLVFIRITPQKHGLFRINIFSEKPAHKIRHSGLFSDHGRKNLLSNDGSAATTMANTTNTGIKNGKNVCLETILDKVFWFRNTFMGQ